MPGLAIMINLDAIANGQVWGLTSRRLSISISTYRIVRVPSFPRTSIIQGTELMRLNALRFSTIMDHLHLPAKTASRGSFFLVLFSIYLFNPFPSH
jgi:hypothetical protein